VTHGILRVNSCQQILRFVVHFGSVWLQLTFTNQQMHHVALVTEFSNKIA